ncbi:Uncharacterised protein [Mycobacterium tuberculosis]|uniref:Uncharacterized protein n=1 Tax=Mycobacterium tuberculosis TaxID=1773 RepID=A0A0U0T2A0_MYCTX|nr:Uncharacterised protein [Mycobacterium tuberculosis]CKR36658.1 Uncharacterised protein [Mycobacterium tuberculosis]CKV70964.1 Uncharacterised protein [Mycobacterium tuberculosis]COV83416.1 Uncharacterised protein [Mycobacterium tuberculosis]COX14653.1 Uncharacterised protein [Mycobacterium tuberculosis]
MFLLNGCWSGTNDSVAATTAVKAAPTPTSVRRMRARAVPDGIAATRSAKATKEIAETTPISVTLTTNRIPATLPLPMVAHKALTPARTAKQDTIMNNR